MLKGEDLSLCSHSQQTLLASETREHGLTADSVDSVVM